MFAISVEPVEIVGFGVRLVLNFVTETRAVRSSLQSFERDSGYLDCLRLGDTDDRVQRVQKVLSPDLQSLKGSLDRRYSDLLAIFGVPEERSAGDQGQHRPTGPKGRAVRLMM